MPFFKINSENKIIITNFKVMFTSFKRTENFTKLKRSEASLRLKLCRPTVYFTVRDPYQKAISFYKDKFQKIPMNADLSKPFKWEKPQRIFFPLMNLSVTENSAEEIKQALINTSFESFIGLLAKCYHLDEHINPQHWIFNHPKYCFLKKLGVDIENVAIFRIEDSADMAEFSSQTGFDFSQKANSTTGINKDYSMSSKMLDTLHSIYDKDFEYFGYERRSIH